MRKGEKRDIALVVDDLPETLRLLTDALEEAGMTVLVALDGEHALSIVDKIIARHHPASMPSCRASTGLTTCRRLKHNRALAHVPIIFMTGLTETEHIIKGLEAGGVDYVTKPIVPDEVLARIRVHLANARMAQSARAALDTFGQIPAGDKPYRPRAVVHAAGGKASWRGVRRFRPRGLRVAARRPGLAANLGRDAAGIGARVDRLNRPQAVRQDAIDLHRANRRR